MVDIEYIMNNPRCAVLCDTEEKARIFVTAALEFGIKNPNGWSGGETNWDSYDEETVYDIDSEGYLSYCYLKWYDDHGYDIWDFEDILFEDISESDQPLSVLFS